MSTDHLFRLHQRCKEITRLHRGGPVKRAAAGCLASLTGCRIYLRYKLFRRPLPEPLDGEAPFVVSLASYPPRMRNLWMTVDTLFRQTSRPAAIFLSLSEAEFPGHVLPASLSPYLDRGLSVLWTSGEDLKPHKKYFGVFRQESAGGHRPVITVDDDVFYAPDTLERLLALHRAYPDAVCANYARRILPGAAYAAWPQVTAPEGPSADLLAVGCGGVLYPPSVYGRACFFNRERILRDALQADDLWLRFCERREGIGVVTGPYCAIPPEIPSSQRVSLSSQNVDEGRNDRIWAALNRPE